MAGITRIRIIDAFSTGQWRQKLSQDHEPLFDELYIKAFSDIGFIISDGVEYLNVSRDEAIARADIGEGIDVILKSTDGMRVTVQEKCLTYWNPTVTFEDKKTSGQPGFWYYGTANYCSFGYDWRYYDWKTRRFTGSPPQLNAWAIVDFQLLRRLDMQGAVNWEYNKNALDGRCSVFRYMEFKHIPSIAVIGCEIVS